MSSALAKGSLSDTKGNRALAESFLNADATQGDGMIVKVDKSKPPMCCTQCQFLGWSDGHEWEPYQYPLCNIGVWMPYRKQTCKRQVVKETAK